MDWIIAALIIAPALVLYFKNPSWLIDYLVWVTVLNRGIRRFVDWMAGSFNPFSPISLTPLMISGLIFLFVVGHYQTFPRYLRHIFHLFAGALAIGFAVGFVRNQFAAVYALAEYVAPLAMMGCAALACGNERMLDRWVKSVGWAAVAVSIYGWYQYYTIPPWDAFWVRAVGFEGYLGQLRPTEMTVFSTMSERGVLAGFLAMAVIPMLVSQRWRNAGGWLSPALILATILLTFVRTAIITIGMAVVLVPILNRGKSTLRTVVLLCVAAMVGNFALGRMPGREKISERLQTIGSITEDGSFRGRIEIAGYGITSLLSNPIGNGLGATGLAGRVNTGAMDAGGTIGDNGYFEILLSFGVIGGGIFFYALWLIWKQVRIFEHAGLRSESLMMFKALFVTGAVVLFAGNWLAGPGSVVFSLFAGFVLFPRAAKGGPPPQ
ncbi:MAG: O-antigen ligase family protein [Verrucomicrobiae bacterium]